MTKLTLQHPTLSQIVTFANGVGVVVVEIGDAVVIVVEIVDVAVVVGNLVEFVEGIVEIVVLGVVVLLTKSSFVDL